MSGVSLNPASKSSSSSESESSSNSKDEPIVISNTRLHSLCNANSFLAANRCIVGADIDARDSDGCTALLVACKAENVGFAKLFLAHRASTDLGDHAGRTPMHFAIRKLNLTFFNLLKDAGAPLDRIDQLGFTPLLRLVSMKCPQKLALQMKFFHLLIDGGASIYSKTDARESILQLMIAADNYPLAEALFNERYFEVDHRNQLGETALFNACYNGRFDFAKLLVQNGANIFITNPKGKLPLSFFRQNQVDELTNLYEDVQASKKK